MGKSVGFVFGFILLTIGMISLIDAAKKEKKVVPGTAGNCTCPENGGSKHGRFCGRDGGPDCKPSSVYVCNNGKVAWERWCEEQWYKCKSIHDFVSCYIHDI
jgi:hypothetical protein